MTMTLRVTLITAVFLALGCGTGLSDDVAAVATSQAELTAACPAKPTAYARGMRLYPTTSASASTVYMQDPSDSQSFFAYGFDPRKKVCVFFIRGSIKASLVSLQNDVATNLELIQRSSPISLDNTGVSQIGRPPAPPWPGGTEALAHSIATRVFDASTAPY